MVNPPCPPCVARSCERVTLARATSLPAKDRPKRRCEHSQNRGETPSRFVTPSRKKYRHRMEAVKDQTPPNESLGGVEANIDNDQYALANHEGVLTAESSEGRTKR